MLELESNFRAAHGNRSCGPDGIPDELFAIFPRALSRLFGSFFVKKLLRPDAPLQWSGGILHELFKGSGVTSSMPNWNSILCSNSGGKRLHAIVRSRVFHFADSWLSSSQCGGRPGIGIDFASHTLKSFLEVLFVIFG